MGVIKTEHKREKTNSSQIGTQQFVILAYNYTGTRKIFIVVHEKLLCKREDCNLRVPIINNMIKKKE